MRIKWEKVDNSQAYSKQGFPSGSAVSLPANARNVGLIPVWGRSPGGGLGNSLWNSCLGNPRQRSLEDYSPSQGVAKESDVNNSSNIINK